jgi:hypothetical protein
VVATLALAGCEENRSAPNPAAPPGDATVPTDASDAGDAADALDAGEDVVPRGARLLGLEINGAEDAGFGAALLLAREAGVEVANVGANWRDIEDVALDAGADASIAYFNDNVHVADLLLPQVGMKASLAIRAVDTPGLVVPPDLAGRPLDDPQVIVRFQAAQDWVFDTIRDLSVATYVLGNEIDVPFGQDPSKWASFGAFFQAAATYARGKRPGLSVGVIATLDGAVAHPELLAPIVAASDFVGVTYYPRDTAYAVRPVSGVGGDLTMLAALFPGKPIVLREAGYPSAASVGSSAEQQASFVRELFRAWDLEHDRISLVTLFTMTDYAPAAAQDLASYYGVTDPKFLDYEGTLGLRTFAGAGAPKPAWDELVRGARLRGW